VCTGSCERGAARRQAAKKAGSVSSAQRRDSAAASLRGADVFSAAPYAFAI
jgi:hypothetical protein